MDETSILSASEGLLVAHRETVKVDQTNVKLIIQIQWSRCDGTPSIINFEGCHLKPSSVL